MAEYYIGEIRLTAFNFAPQNWHTCDGSLLSVTDSQYQALFSLIGTFYGGDGVRNFAIPNLNGRGMIGSAAAYPIGAKAGWPQATLSPQTMPAHTHQAVFNMGTAPSVKASIAVNSVAGTQPSPAGGYLAPSMKGTAPINTYGTAPTANATLGGVVSGGSMSGTVAIAGQGAMGPVPLSTLPPVLYLNYIICYVGLYPTRPS